MPREISLVPAEALRLAALGMLAEAPRRYGELAAEIRLFASRIVGPSIELMGTSVELLRYEGLADAAEANGPSAGDNVLLAITESGREALSALLRAPLKTPGYQFNRLFLALKLRFLHHLPGESRAEQIAAIAEWMGAELTRLDELRRHHRDAPALFLDWLDLECAQIQARIDWLAAAPPTARIAS